MLAELESALSAEAQREVEDALRVSVCVSNGLSRNQTAERLDLSPARVKSSVERLRSAARSLGWHPEQF